MKILKFENSEILKSERLEACDTCPLISDLRPPTSEALLPTANRQLPTLAYLL